MIDVKKSLYLTDFSSYSNQAYFTPWGWPRRTALASRSPTSMRRGSTGDQSHWREQLEQVRPANRSSR